MCLSGIHAPFDGHALSRTRNDTQVSTRYMLDVTEVSGFSHGREAF